MSTTIGTAGETVCIPDERSLPDGPFTSLRYHFGMLLGVDDFSTEQRYHRGKMRLHSAWLHRSGIVWGLDVDAALEKRELRVEPGLALDPVGRELHLDVRCCMDVGAWFDEHADEVDVTHAEGSDTYEFDGHVELLFCSCGTRPVPAIAGPCDGATADTAYARTFETVSIRFVPGTAPAQAPPYPRLRLLFGIDDGAAAELTQDERDAIDQARADVTASATPAATLLEKFRELADADTVAMTPAEPPDGSATVFPALDDAGVVLANVHVTLQGSTGSWTLTDAALDRTPRRAHVATQTIEELLCGRVLETPSTGDGAGDAGAGGTPDAGGPRATGATLDRDAKKITLTVDGPLEPQSVGHDAFRVSRLEGGWEPLKVGSATLADDGLSVNVVLTKNPGESLVRFIARGTGQTPLLGADHVPFAGGSDSPPGGPHDGHDYVQMFTA